MAPNQEHHLDLTHDQSLVGMNDGYAVSFPEGALSEQLPNPMSQDQSSALDLEYDIILHPMDKELITSFLGNAQFNRPATFILLKNLAKAILYGHDASQAIPYDEIFLCFVSLLMFLEDKRLHRKTVTKTQINQPSLFFIWVWVVGV